MLISKFASQVKNLRAQIPSCISVLLFDNCKRGKLSRSGKQTSASILLFWLHIHTHTCHVNYEEKTCKIMQDTYEHEAHEGFNIALAQLSAGDGSRQRM